MIFGITPKWRRAPVIILLCYIFAYFNNLVHCIHLIPSYKLSFVGYKFINKPRIPSEIRNFEPLISLPKHTENSFSLSSSFTLNSSFRLNSFFTDNLFNRPFSPKNLFKSFFSNIFPSKFFSSSNLFNKSFFTSDSAKSCKNKSPLANFWSSLKSYLTSKFSSVKGTKVSAAPKRFTRSEPYPRNDLSEHHTRNDLSEHHTRNDLTEPHTRNGELSDPYPRNNDLRHLSFFEFFDNPPDKVGDYKIRKEFNESMTQESPYMELVRTGPSGIIKKFLKIAPSMVKDAISLTVSTLIGSFYRYSAETTIITTTDRLAALILNLQITGYIYCNAEQRYRLSTLYNLNPSTSPISSLNSQTNIGQPNVNQTNTNQPNVNQVNIGQCEQKEDFEGLSVGDELLSYVRRLPRSYINGIFDNMNPEILYAMRYSTENAIQLLTVLNHNYLDVKDHQKLIIQQTGSFAMQLCFWKLALGYCMRHQETKIELTKSLNSH
ncbi:hypothetical protein TpMuguga_01g00131 [Theileria parva strain Muguga]|uniref:Uncharacterized protein n=1 Tax=Theileria parva TaxID=5875 RepID=Q4N9I3_THEPA|nr:uncharacterized protein TpMuguga_01g00131 [Theileria parva strain Muguga]EAN33375.1 hypothetical protein TpMuguga_01g00131 [Theileria parva strain Muguga]|eukprot:XP_765658.1 hypothetical protein [Theileria parva strain Muguga]